RQFAAAAQSPQVQRNVLEPKYQQEYRKGWQRRLVRQSGERWESGYRRQAQTLRQKASPRSHRVVDDVVRGLLLQFGFQQRHHLESRLRDEFAKHEQALKRVRRLESLENPRNLAKACTRPLDRRTERPAAIVVHQLSSPNQLLDQRKSGVHMTRPWKTKERRARHRLVRSYLIWTV